MGCHCPTCGCEFEDVNELVANRNAALRSIEDRQRRERYRQANWDIARQAQQPGAAYEDNFPRHAPSDPGEAFLSEFGKGGRRR